MRSDTLTPLKQFVEWLGISPWYVAGIDIVSSTPTPNVKDTCRCTFQHPWDVSADNWSRDELIDLLKLGERIFFYEANFHVAPTQILEEYHNYPMRGLTKGSLGNSENKYKSVKPFLSHKLVEFGTFKLNKLADVPLVRFDGPDLMTSFYTQQIVLPSGVDYRDLVFYFTPSDGSYDEDLLSYNDGKRYEIRPLEVLNYDPSTNTVVVGGSAYLFKKPSLDESTTCLAHEGDTYVSEVSAYYITYDSCQQGQFIGESANCVEGDCFNITSDLCLSKRVVGNHIYAVPKPFACGVGETPVKYKMNMIPTTVKINYVTGNKLNNWRVEDNLMSIVGKLSISLADCIKEWCKCDRCSNEKINYYRQVPRVKIDVEKDLTQYDQQYAPLVTKETLNRIGNVMPTLGFLQAIREIESVRGDSLTGGIV